MPYLGRPVTNAGQFEIIDDISSSFNGSTTSFTLQVNGTNIQPDVGYAAAVYSDPCPRMLPTELTDPSVLCY